MNKIILTFLLTAFILCFIQLDTVAQKSKSYKPKTVKVRSYTTKKGKTVRSYYRSKPSRRKTSGVFKYTTPFIGYSELRKANKASYVYN